MTAVWSRLSDGPALLRALLAAVARSPIVSRPAPAAARGLDDPAGNLAAIGDEDALEHAAKGPRNRL